MNAGQQTISGALAGNWIVGLIWGANVVLFSLVIYVLFTRASHSINRRLILFTITIQLLLATAHAGASLADLVICFVVTSKGSVDCFRDTGRAAVIAQLVLYALNVHIGDYFIVWRVWVLWGRRTALAIPFLFLNLSTVVLGLAATAELSHTHSIDNPLPRYMTATAWIISLIVQGGGTLLIAWRVWSTPTVSISSSVTSAKGWMLLWVAVESGVLYSGTTLFAIALMAGHSPYIDIAVAPLSQIATFVPLTIILREHYKVSARLRAAGTATTFLVDERELVARSLSLRHAGNVGVAINTSTRARVDQRDPKLGARQMDRTFLPVL